MSDSISGYLAISKNEQSYIDKFAKNDPATQQGVAALSAKAATLSTPAALLADRKSLAVVLQAFNMSADINQTAVLKALMTQDPTASTSLAAKSGNNNFKAFGAFMANVSTVVVGLGPPATLALTTHGAAASSITVQNTAFDADADTQTSKNVAKQWGFVLNDGAANASVQSALAAAAGNGASYTINTDGSVTVSAGAPPVTVTKDSVGGAVYTLALAADTKGNVIKQASIVSVPVTAGTTPADATGQVNALIASLKSVGFGAAQNANGSLVITGQGIDATANKAATTTTTVPGAGAIATTATTTTDQVLAFGLAGAALQAGQVVHDGANVLGTIQSVDSQGNVTLTAPATAAVAKGDYLTVDALVKTGVLAAATAASISNIGFQVAATAATTTSDSVLALGATAVGLQAGQVVQSGGTVLGTIASVDSGGNVTLTQKSAATVAAGAMITVAAAATAATTPALQNVGRVATAIAEYKTNQYEQAQDLANPGMHEALYFTRSIANVTSINQLMSDPTLLSVVTTNLGLPTAFGGLDYDQQVRILTKDVDLTKFQNPSYVQKSAEQYLAYKQASQPATLPTGTLALFGGGADAGQAMLAILGGQTLTTSGTAAANSALALFA